MSPARAGRRGDEGAKVAFRRFGPRSSRRIRSAPIEFDRGRPSPKSTPVSAEHGEHGRIRAVRTAHRRLRGVPRGLRAATPLGRQGERDQDRGRAGTRGARRSGDRLRATGVATESVASRNRQAGCDLGFLFGLVVRPGGGFCDPRAGTRSTTGRASLGGLWSARKQGGSPRGAHGRLGDAGSERPEPRPAVGASIQPRTPRRYLRGGHQSRRSELLDATLRFRGVRPNARRRAVFV